MSEKLERHKHFLKLLITTTDTQAKALLSIATLDQIECLSEIAYNLLSLKIFHHRQKKLLEFLSNPALSRRKQQRAIVKYNRILLHILKEVKYIIEEL